MSDASFNEQLLTALFDGELRGTERERAERLLAENSECKQLFESWQAQAAGLRDLPRYRLDERFASAVMGKIESQPALAPATGALTNWQTGFAAIATLAAMLLLTLFVFPNVTGLTPVANLTADKAEVKEFSADPNEIESAAEEAVITDADEAIVSKAVEFRDARTMKKDLAGGNDGIMSRGGLDYANERAKPRAKKSGPVEFAEKSLSGAAIHAAPSSKSSAAPSVEQPLVSRGAGNDADDELAALKNQGSAVEQILWIDMQHREQPMDEVEAVLANNLIRLLDSENGQLTINGLGQQGIAKEKTAPPPGARMSKEQRPSRVFDDRSEAGMEALYVVATAAQMRQAIVELSDQANIAGYQVPRNQVQQRFAGGGLGQGTDSVTANISPTDQEGSSQQADQPQSVQSIGRQGGGLAAQTEGQGARVPVASAQQLVPYQFGNSQIATLNEAANLPAEQGEEIAKEIQEIDSWFRLPNRQSDTELVQYLLLVRTSPADPASASARESADMEPGDEGSADR